MHCTQGIILASSVRSCDLFPILVSVLYPCLKWLSCNYVIVRLLHMLNAQFNIPFHSTIPFHRIKTPILMNMYCQSYVRRVLIVVMNILKLLDFFMGSEYFTIRLLTMLEIPLYYNNIFNNLMVNVLSP